jgi:hypothetical protein
MSTAAVRGGARPVGRQRRHRAPQDVVQIRRHRPAGGADTRRGLAQPPGEDRRDAATGGGRLAGQHLVRHAAQRVQVAPPVQVLFPARLFRAQVRRRADDDARRRQTLGAGRRNRQRDAEVGHAGVTRLQQDVLGLDVAMHDPVAVGVTEGVGDFARDADGLVDGQLVLAVQPLPQRFALHERHDVVEESRRLARVVERKDVGVGQVGGDPDLLEEPLGAQNGGQLGSQHLDGHLAGMPAVLGQVDRGHASATQLPLDAVPIRECGFELRERVVQ